MRIGATLLGLGLLLATPATEARELELYLENRIGGDSNVFRRESTRGSGAPSPKSGGVYEISPRITLRDQTYDDTSYQFSYQPTFEQFFALGGTENVGDVSGLDHTAFADVRWNLSPATTISANGAFFRQRRVREEIEGVSTGARTLNANDDSYVQRGRGGFDVQRSLGPKLGVNAGYGFDDLDMSEADQSDTRSHRGTVGVNYVAGPHTQVGVSFNVRERNTKATTRSFETGPITEYRSNTRTYDVSFSLNHEITEHWNVSVAVGPSFFTTRDEQSPTTLLSSVPPFVSPNGPPNTRNDESIFAQAQMEYRTRRGAYECSYVRSESGGGGGAAATSIYDDVRCKGTYRPVRDWSLRLEAGWNRRESLSSSFRSGLETRSDVYTASGYVTHFFTNRLSVIGGVSWAELSQDEFRVSPGLNRTLSTTYVFGSVAVRFTLDPYVF